MLNLTTQHKLGILQGIIIQQRVQFCPLCGAWQYLLIKDRRGRPLYFNTEADDRMPFFHLFECFFQSGVHAGNGALRANRPFREHRCLRFKLPLLVQIFQRTQQIVGGILLK